MNYLKFKFEKMKRYNFNIKVLMFFLLSFLTINKTYATHIIGGDITYRYISGCLLYTSDAADERSSVDLGGRRIIKKKTLNQS